MADLVSVGLRFSGLGDAEFWYSGLLKEANSTIHGMRGEPYDVIVSSGFVVMWYSRVGRKVAFAGCEVSGGTMGVLYSYSTRVEVGSSLEGGLV